MVAKRRLEAKHDRRTALAWHMAALTRTKDLPKLETLLVNKRRARKQSAKEQVAIWQAIAARFGGSFQPIDRRTVTRGR